MAASKPWCLVSPASRGIGLALTRHLLKTTNVPIVATVRRDTIEARVGYGYDHFLERLEDVDPEDAKKRLHIMTLNVRNEKTIEHTAKAISRVFPFPEHHLRLAFCIPGILHVEKNISQVDPNDALETFRINTLGPLLQMKHFAQFLPKYSTKLPPKDDESDLKGLPKRGSVFAVMSARVGSIGDNRAGGWYSYRASKAGVTQLAKTFDVELKMLGGYTAKCVALHPGTVRTDFTKGLRDSYEKQGKVISASESAEALMNVVNNLKDKDRGKFWDWNGKEVPP